MQDFKYDGDENGTFHPYVLDIIRSIVIDHQSIETDLSEFSSHYLRNKIKMIMSYLEYVIEKGNELGKLI